MDKNLDKFRLAVRKYRLVVLAALIVITLMCLIPPWVVKWRGVVAERKYGFIFWPPHMGEFMGEIDIARLLMQMVVVIGIAFIVYYALEFMRGEQ